jgi:hypothetical protein
VFVTLSQLTIPRAIRHDQHFEECERRRYELSLTLVRTREDDVQIRRMRLISR